MLDIDDFDLQGVTVEPKDDNLFEWKCSIKAAVSNTPTPFLSYSAHNAPSPIRLTRMARSTSPSLFPQTSLSRLLPYGTWHPPKPVWSI